MEEAMGIDSRLARNIHHMLRTDELEPIPQSLLDRIVHVQDLLRPFARPIDIQHLAILIAEWEKAKDLEEYLPGQKLDYQGEEVTFVRKPGGKQEGKLHVRLPGQASGKYKVVEESEVKLSETV